ncbi:MAG: helix-turn-helix domain-containing protein [Thermotogae bacterium]|nr:helix-turn-helix domain-containing protein [Thermotogota bacterium]
MNIKEISRVIGLPYSTTRKYLNTLEEKGLIKQEKTPKGVECDDKAIDILKTLVELVKHEPLSSAIDKIKSSDPTLSVLLERMDKLEEENRKLREIVQIYLSRIDKLENQLMPPKNPKKNLFQRIFKKRSKT